MQQNICEKSFAICKSYGNFYSGGDVVWSKEGSQFYCLNKAEVNVVGVLTGQVEKRFSVNPETNDTSKYDHDIPEDSDLDIIYCFAINEERNCIVTAHRSQLIRLWDLESGNILKLWKSQHKSPVVKLQFSPCGSYICSSGADSTLRIVDYSENRCVAVLKEFEGPSLLINFHPNSTKTEIYAAGSNNVIYCWNYLTKNLERQYRGHLSQVTGMSFKDDTKTCQYLATSSRDKVLIIWNLANGEKYKVIPLYEELEGVAFFNNPVEQESDTMNVIVACAKGNLKLVDCRKSKISNLSNLSEYEIKFMFLCQATNQLAIVTTEHNILVYDKTNDNELNCSKQMIGFNDEILDLSIFGAQDRYLAVATNSNSFKVYDTADNMNCKIVAGHTDTVMTLSSNNSSNLLLSAGKDFSIMLWETDESSFTIQCIAKNINSHISAIGSICFGYNVNTNLASAGQDGSLKVWKLKVNKSKDYAFNVITSAIAHEKEINCVTYSPNNKLIATASLDKTAKLWNADTLGSLGTLRGHTRSVYCVRFSPVDQIVLTASSDCSMRIWSIANMSCLKRFEQDSTVLRAEFIDHGKFILSGASDGLVKVWNVKTNTCLQTLDGHTDRVWSLAISGQSKKYFFSGSADSKLIQWIDNTDENRSMEIDKRQSMMEQEQALQSLLQEERNLQKAFHLALTLCKPKTTYKVLSHYVRKRDLDVIQDMIAKLNPDQRNTLMDHVKVWSTNSRYCRVANIILHYLLSDFIANPKQQSHNTGNVVEVLTPYVQRHFKRLTELKQDLAFLEFMVECI